MLESGEEPVNLDDSLPDAQLFAMKIVDVYYEYIVHFLTTRREPEGFNTTHKK